jgi:C1A family cysteine protease
VHGITKFADYTHSEFMRLNNADPSLQSASPKETLTSVPLTTTATSVDWTGKYTTPVKDQGYCGSCWAFSAAEQIESDAMRTLGYSTQLSPAQITQCDTRSSGCNGGWTEFAYNYVKGNRGLETAADYPYTSTMYAGTTGRCAADYTKAKIGVTSYTTIKGETNMANYVLSTGPLSVCLDATQFNSYTGGIMTRCGTNVNHCVQAVGVNTGSGGYWKVRNSWGTGWGESGFIRLAYGQNTCAITNDPTYVSVYKV